MRRPHGFTGRVQDWMTRNRAWTAALLAFVGTGCVLFYGSKKLNGKRRKARKAGNGARKEIVGTLIKLVLLNMLQVLTNAYSHRWIAP